MVRTLALAMAAFSICLAAVPVQAGATGVLTEGQLHDAIATCRLQTTAITRLDCYDAIALPEAEIASELATTDSGAASAKAAQSGAPQSRTAQDEEAEFGFEFDVKDALQSVTSDVTRVQKNAMGGLVLTLANGQVWQQNDGQTLFLDEGDSVTITRGALSAFYLTRDGKGRRYKFTRVQ
jgi:hypothetical protein